MDPAAREAERIRTEYRRRDSTASSRETAWLDPVHRLGLQTLEWALLDELGRTGITLAGARALEVGCGSGYFLSRLLDYGVSQGAGIDLVDERIAIARERYPQLELVVGDASQLPWADGSFQLVTQFTCLSSVLDTEVRRAIATEMWRVLAPGGALVSYDMRPPPGPIRTFRRLVSRGAQPPAASAPLDVADLRAWLRGAQMRERALGVDPELAGLLRRLRLPVRPATRVRALSVHALAVARKPAG
jgi:SAM-dependent methyltransferase